MGNYPWKDVPRGSQTLGDIPLEIGGMICTYGEANAKNRQVYPKSVEGIHVARKFDALYLYHATFHPSADGAPVVQLVFRYENGKRFEKQICYGTHVRDWYRYETDPDEMGDPRSKRVWTGMNSTVAADPPRRLQFFITEIANPNPELEITTIDLFAVPNSNSASCILAMTTGPAGLLKVERKAFDEKEQE